MNNPIQHFIGGQLDQGFGTRTGDVLNPSTGATNGVCHYADAATLDKAVVLAQAAAKKWGAASHARRLNVIFKFRELLLANTDRLAIAIGLEHGKTLEDARGEIGRGLEAVEFATNAPHASKGEYSRNVGGGIDVFSTTFPLGVVGCIAPFNFPVMVPLVMATMAVAVGNAVILKPSERVPTSAMILSELWSEAGLPAGVWSVVHGDREVVDAMLVHHGIAAISFVGSTLVGEHIHKVGSAHGKRVGAFTGGKNHMVVMPDADLEAAANAFVAAAYGSASQRCMAVSLLLPVGDETAERLNELIIPKIKALKVGAYDDPKADFGALITAQSKQNVLKAIDDCLAAGGELLVDGRNLVVPGFEEGFYVGPTLFDRVTTDMTLYKEEIFGPARGIVRVKSLDEAIAVTNSHEFGNGAVIFTRSGLSAQRYITEVEAGMVGVNVAVPVPVGYHNFGGLRRSKFGESHLFGPDAVRFYTKIKTVSQRWPDVDLQPQSVSLAFPSNG